MKTERPMEFIPPEGIKAGFTLLEVVTVIVIISILVSILLPAISQIKKVAMETKQKAQLYSLEVAIESYKDDDSKIGGAYPPSHGYNPAMPPPFGADDYDYCGAQTLAEALLGYDLLGVHPDTAYRGNGLDIIGNPTLYPPCPPCPTAANLDLRRGPFLDKTSMNVFQADEVYPSLMGLPGQPKQNAYLICDIFPAVTRQITLPNGTIKTCKIGTPVLYFRANPSPVNTQLTPNANPVFHIDNRYNYMDNFILMSLGKVVDSTQKHKLAPSPGDNGVAFYRYIMDPMIPASPGLYGQPARPDSYLLISAGYDGVYGTKDDICNFEPNY